MFVFIRSQKPHTAWQRSVDTFNSNVYIDLYTCMHARTAAIKPIKLSWVLVLTSNTHHKEWSNILILSRTLLYYCTRPHAYSILYIYIEHSAYSLGPLVAASHQFKAYIAPVKSLLSLSMRTQSTSYIYPSTPNIGNNLLPYTCTHRTPSIQHTHYASIFLSH